MNEIRMVKRKLTIATTVIIGIRLVSEMTERTIGILTGVFITATVSADIIHSMLTAGGMAGTSKLTVLVC